MYCIYYPNSCLYIFHIYIHFILLIILLFQEYYWNLLVEKYMLEKIPCYGEFIQRSDPWAGLIASRGSFYPMVLCLSSLSTISSIFWWIILLFDIFIKRICKIIYRIFYILIIYVSVRREFLFEDNNPGIWYLWIYSRNRISFLKVFFLLEILGNVFYYQIYYL